MSLGDLTSASHVYVTSAMRIEPSSPQLLRSDVVRLRSSVMGGRHRQIHVSLRLVYTATPEQPRLHRENPVSKTKTKAQQKVDVVVMG